jgi:hypothetical protein
MLVRFVMIAAFTFKLLEISWSQVMLLLLKRSGFSVAFGSITWCTDRSLQALHMPAGFRLSVIAALCVVLLGSAIWSASYIVFGRQAVHFLLGYADHLPPAYVRRLRLHDRPRANEVGALTRI